MSTTQAELIGPLLRDVSRSFYLTLRVLPKEIRPQVSLAYLLARATDTITDTKAVPREKRVALLEQSRAEFLKGNVKLVPMLVVVEDRHLRDADGKLLSRLSPCIK